MSPKSKEDKDKDANCAAVINQSAINPPFVDVEATVYVNEMVSRRNTLRAVGHRVARTQVRRRWWKAEYRRY